MSLPSPRHIARLLVALAAVSAASAFAQSAKPDTAATEDAAPKPFVIPPDINGYKTIVSPSARLARPLRVAIYEGPGSGDGGVQNVEDGAKRLPGAKVTRLAPAQIGTVDLSSNFDVIVFSGGSGSGQAKAIGEAGRANVKKFVENGGGYVGVCAGAYLACANYEWSLGILDARTVSSKWKRGRGFLDLDAEPAGESIFGKVSETFKVRYNNGPVIKPMGSDDIPDYKTVFTFKTEVAENDTPVGVQVGSPAMAIGEFGKGRVFISSPHPENTPGLENIIPRALAWASGAELKK